MDSTHSPSEGASRTTLRTLRRWAVAGQRFAMLTCYDAITARWLWRGGLRCMLVGDTAAQMILGHDSTLPVPLPFMLEITAAVRRGAPNAFVLGDMPFGSYQCGDDAAMTHATAFLTQGHADAVKLEVEIDHAPLVRRMAAAGIPVIPHLGSRPQRVRQEGGFSKFGRNATERRAVLDAAAAMIEAGASGLLVEAIPDELSRQVIELTIGEDGQPSLPVIGCGAGPSCHGEVVVLHDVLGLSDWQAPFAPPMTHLGPVIAEAAGKWREHVDQARQGGPAKHA